MGEEVLKVQNLVKSYGKDKIIKDISFNVNAGEIVGFVGPNGAGKTTTLKMIGNLIWPDSGSIEICGFNLFKEREKALSNMAGIIESPGLYTDLSGKENLMFIKNLRGVSKERYEEIVHITGLEKFLHRKVRKYSLGMKQRLALGMSLMTKPKFLILDEPTNGLDPSGTIELRELIVNMSRKENVATFFSSHLLGEVEKITDRVIYIKEGQIINETTYKEEIETVYSISINDEQKALELLKTNTNISHIELSNHRIIFSIKKNNIENIIKQLVQNNLSIIEIEKQKEDVEAIYNSIFRGEKNHA